MTVIVIYDLFASDIEQVVEPGIIARDEPIDSILGDIDMLDSILIHIAFEGGGKEVIVTIMNQDFTPNVSTNDVPISYKRECLIIIPMCFGTDHLTRFSRINIHRIFLGETNPLGIGGDTGYIPCHCVEGMCC